MLHGHIKLRHASTGKKSRDGNRFKVGWGLPRSPPPPQDSDPDSKGIPMLQHQPQPHFQPRLLRFFS